jgi:hypothetical protein
MSIKHVLFKMQFVYIFRHILKKILNNDLENKGRIIIHILL